MNQQIRELLKQASKLANTDENKDIDRNFDMIVAEKFAELIVRECCLALWTEECHTSDLAFDEVKRNATRIKEHFGIDPNEVTEDMLARSIKWMEQQLVDKKNFGVK